MRKKNTDVFKHKQTAGDYIFTVINYTVFITFTIICIFPIYYLFINTISNNELVKIGAINWYPKGIHFNNYLALLNVNDLANSAIVTLERTLLGTAFMVLASAFAGYLVTKREMFGRSMAYRIIIITMYFNAGLVPWYLNMSMLGLTNNFWGYVIPGIISPFNIILIKTYVESIPAELEESAFLDGAGYLKVFSRIVLPLCKPILATITVFGMVGHWNSFTDSIILMGGEPKLYTLQHRLYVYLNTTSNLGQLMTSGSINQTMLSNALNNRTISLTIAMVTIIPILLVYPFMQRYFEKGLMLGAVKG